MTSPDNNKSWEAMEEMLHNAEEFYKSLGLGYQVRACNPCLLAHISVLLVHAAGLTLDRHLWVIHTVYSSDAQHEGCL